MREASVLIVEPESDQRKALVAAVRQSPHTLYAQAADMDAGLFLCRELTPDIVIFPLRVDPQLGLVGLDAYATAAGDAGMIVTYGPTERQKTVAATRAGAVACVRKPVGREAVLAALGRAARARDPAGEKGASGIRTLRLAGRVKRPGVFWPWKDAVVSEIGPGGLTVTSEVALKTGEKLHVQIDLPKETEPVGTSIRVRKAEPLPAGLWRCMSTYERLSGDARMRLAKHRPPDEARPEAPQAPAKKTPLPIEDPSGGPGRFRAAVRRAKGYRGAFVITLSGALDGSLIDAVGKLLDAIPLKNTALVIDLSDVPRIDSSGIGILFSVAGRVKRVDGRVALCGLQPEPRTLLGIVHVEQVFGIHADVATALEALAGPKPAPKEGDP